jgi:hypothetical protein
VSYDATLSSSTGRHINAQTQLHEPECVCGGGTKVAIARFLPPTGLPAERSEFSAPDNDEEDDEDEDEEEDADLDAADAWRCFLARRRRNLRLRQNVSSLSSLSSGLTSLSLSLATRGFVRARNGS